MPSSILFLVSYHTREPVVSKDETEYYIIRRVEQTREIMPMPFLPSKQIKEKVFVSLAKNLTPKKSKERILIKFSMNVDWWSFEKAVFRVYCWCRLFLMKIDSIGSIDSNQCYLCM